MARNIVEGFTLPRRSRFHYNLFFITHEYRLIDTTLIDTMAVKEALSLDTTALKMVQSLSITPLVVSSLLYSARLYFTLSELSHLSSPDILTIADI